MLRMATPLAVPLVSSSNFDCSQVRVPSANAVDTSTEALTLDRKRLARSKRKSFRALCNFIPRSDVGAEYSGYHAAWLRGCRPKPGGPGRTLILRGIVGFHPC